MKSWIVKCKVITPLFMGGAYQQTELRTQSINGLLRWWFRIAGGSLEDEKRIFGWAGETSNQGVVRIFIKEPPFQSQEFSAGQPGYNYLGFSLKLTKRRAVPENKTFDLKISFHPKATDDDIKKFFCALWLAFNLGNFGSRARRGFGSIKIEKIQKGEQDITNNCFELNFVPSGDLGNWIRQNLEKIKDIIGAEPRKDIPYLFSNFEIYQIQKGNFNNLGNWVNQVQQGRQGRYLKKSWGGNNVNNWKDLLNFMGFLLMAYRSYRNPDYNNAKNILQKRHVANPVFERAIFGLPLNFYFSSIGEKGRGDMVNLKLGNDTLRRASPLMIKIIQNGNNYEGLFIVMKSTFMPANSRLVFSNKNVNLPSNNTSNNIWQALDDFLSSLKNHNLIKKIYP
jgi:CRISPR-associated protein Cmr1